jgi:hypothetical protein
MSAAGAAAAAAMMQAVRAMGVIVKVKPEEFVKIVRRASEPLIVRAPHGIFSSKHDYLVSYKGFAFYTSTNEDLRLPPDAELMEADSMYVPG